MDRQRINEHERAWLPSADAAEPLEEPSAPDWPRGPETLETAPHTPQPTTRELLALQLVARGYTSTQIARLLNTTTDVVDLTLEQMVNRLGAVHRIEAVAIAIRLGLVA